MPEWLKSIKYCPHMTIGCANKNVFEKAFEKLEHLKDSFETIVKEVNIEIIDENDNSIIEIIHRL